MKFQVKFPDGRVEETAHSAISVEHFAVSGFGCKLEELTAAGYELTVVDEKPVEDGSGSSNES